MGRNNSVTLLLGIALVIAGLGFGLFLVGGELPVLPAVTGLRNGRGDELKPGDYFTVVDEARETIDRLGRALTPGDELITPEGKHYRVERISGKMAQARLIGIDRDVLAWEEYFDRAAVSVGIFGRSRAVGIYHTHSDESYVPTGGAAAIPYRGGIFKVGSHLSDKLERNGVRVLHDTTPHDPHDAYAYIRSRKTAVRLLRANPIALLDVHRDGVPDPDFYRRHVAGTTVGQVRLVVGRQNPRMSSNLDFAKRLMTYANRVHPGLVKGIFLSNDSYNQDLMPTALLLECGTHTISRLEAERGVRLLADGIPVVLGITGPRPDLPESARPVTHRTTPGVWRALAWVLVATVIGVGTFLLISAGSWEAARERLRAFWRREANVFRVRGRRGDDGA